MRLRFSALAALSALIVPSEASEDAVFSINIPEIFRQPYYGIKFAHQPPEDSDARESIKIKLADSLPFICHLPSNVSEPVQKTPITDKALLKAAAELVTQNGNPQLFFRDLFWTYHFDRLKGSIYQLEAYYTPEGGMAKVQDGMNFKLGQDQGSLYFVDSDVRDNRVVLRKKFADGDICDITGRPREIDVVYYCDPTIDRTWPELASVVETGICMYEAKVLSSALCSLKEFQKATIVTNNITCSPVDGEITESVGDFLLAEAMMDLEDFNTLFPQSEHDGAISGSLGVSLELSVPDVNGIVDHGNVDSKPQHEIGSKTVVKEVDQKIVIDTETDQEAVAEERLIYEEEVGSNKASVEYLDKEIVAEFSGDGEGPVHQLEEIFEHIHQEL